MKWINACITLFAIHAKTLFELPRHSPIRRSSPTSRPGAGDSDPLLEKGQLSRKVKSLASSRFLEATRPTRQWRHVKP